MGEAKRRKILDPNFGQETFISLTSNGQTLKIRPGLVEGFITLKENFELDLELNCSFDECEFISQILQHCAEAVLEKYNSSLIKYVLRVDLRNFVKTLKGRMLVYPAYWDLEPPKMRGYREVEFGLQEIVKLAENPIERCSPKEHIRSAHMRRVAYGKGRSLRKWMHIEETVVNAQ